MWNRALAARARHYPSGVLTVVEASGYPSSVRCQTVFDDATELIRLPAVAPMAAGWRGQACLLFHRHNARLEEQYELLITGDLAEETGGLVCARGPSSPARAARRRTACPTREHRWI